MKKKYLFFSLIVLCFFSFTSFVSALECKYDYTFGESWNSSATVKISNDYKTASVIITKFDNKNKNNKEDVLNWKDVQPWVSSNQACPNYAVISYYSGEVNGAKFYLYTDRDSAAAKVKELGSVTHAVYGRSDLAIYENFDPSEEDDKYYYDRLEKIQDDFVTYMDNYSWEFCVSHSSGKTGNELKTQCINNLKTTYEGTLLAVEELIEKGLIDENDSRTQDFFDLYDSYSDEYDELMRDIASRDPSETANPGGNGTNDDLDTDISLANVCEEPTIARTLKFIGLVLFLAKIMVPAIIIVMGSIDFAKAMLAGKSDELSKKIPVFIKRFLIGVIIFFIPTIIDFLFGVIDTYNPTIEKYKNCHNCILTPDNCVINK